MALDPAREGRGVKLKAGRSTKSYMLMAWKNAHLFVWLPRMGTDSLGATFRVRRGGGWRHWRVTVLQRNHNPNAKGPAQPPVGTKNRPKRERYGKPRPGKFIARRSLTLFELSWWKTAPGVRDRIGLKGYVRLKASAGGRPAV